LEVLQDFPRVSQSIPFEYFFDLIGPIQPRAFSIASSLLAHRDEIQLLVAVVHYKTKLHKPRQGLCSTWLAHLRPNKAVHIRVPVWVKRGTISFPKSPDTPVIMVGPGTGCAPFRSFIQERITNLTEVLHNPSNILFFGCRSETKDFFCHEEWLPLIKNNQLQLFTAFSRDQEHKIYVQQRIIENGPFIWELLLTRQAWFMIAGNAKQMPSDVTNSLKTVLHQEGGMTDFEIEEYMKKLERDRRFQLETWS
jgi:sulfite reductase alpha subunit-like flavoprotein